MDIDDALTPDTGSTPSLTYGLVQIHATKKQDGVYLVSRQVLNPDQRSYKPGRDDAFLYVGKDGSGRLTDLSDNLLVELDDWRGALKGWPL